jgi:hypothetical protein
LPRDTPGKRERLDELGRREELLIRARRPADEGEEVAERLRDEALVAIRRDRHHFAVLPLRELRAVGRVDERQVRERGRLLAESLVDEDLLVGVGQVVLAADHMADRHVDVVTDDDEVVERRAVRTQEGEVFRVLVLALLGSVDAVLEHRGAVALGHQESQREGLACGGAAVGLFTRQGTRRDIALPRALLRVRLLALGLHLGHGRERAIGLARGQKLGRDLTMTLDAVALEEGTLVPVEPQPLQALEDALRVLVRRPFLVGVLDAEDVGAAVLLCIEPVEKGGAAASDVEVAGRRGGETNTDGRVTHGVPAILAAGLRSPRGPSRNKRTRASFYSSTKADPPKQ